LSATQITLLSTISKHEIRKHQIFSHQIWQYQLRKTRREL
jgi:hypothetical protein